MFINRKSNVSYLKCVAFFSFIRLNNSHISSKVTYKGRPLLYAPNAKDPQKRVIYHRVVEMLEEGQAISKIAKEVNITRQTIYRIKKDNDLL